MKLSHAVAHKSQLFLNLPCAPQWPLAKLFCYCSRKDALASPELISRGLTSSLRKKKAIWHAAPKDDWPFISGVIEEDVVEHGACWMILLNLQGSTGEWLTHRALSLPKDLHHTATTECLARNKNIYRSTSHAKSWMSWPFSFFLTCFGLEPTLKSLWKEDTSD